MLPDPKDVPLLRPDDIIGLHPLLKRSAVYEAIRRKELPALRIGSRIYLPTAAVRRMLLLDVA